MSLQTFILSSELDLPVMIRLAAVFNLPPPPNTKLPFSSPLSQQTQPLQLLSPWDLDTTVEFYISCEIYSDSIALTPTPTFSSVHSINYLQESQLLIDEWLTLPVLYKDLTANSTFVINLWGIQIPDFDQNDAIPNPETFFVPTPFHFAQKQFLYPIGGTVFQVFNQKGRMKNGIRRLYITPGTVAHGINPHLTPHKRPDHLKDKNDNIYTTPPSLNQTTSIKSPPSRPQPPQPKSPLNTNLGVYHSVPPPKPTAKHPKSGPLEFSFFPATQSGPTPEQYDAFVRHTLLHQPSLINTPADNLLNSNRYNVSWMNALRSQSLQYPQLSPITNELIFGQTNLRPNGTSGGFGPGSKSAHSSTLTAQHEFLQKQGQFYQGGGSGNAGLYNRPFKQAVTTGMMKEGCRRNFNITHYNGHFTNTELTKQSDLLTQFHLNMINENKNKNDKRYYTNSFQKNNQNFDPNSPQTCSSNSPISELVISLAPFRQPIVYSQVDHPTVSPFKQFIRPIDDSRRLIVALDPEAVTYSPIFGMYQLLSSSNTIEGKPIIPATYQACLVGPDDPSSKPSKDQIVPDEDQLEANMLDLLIQREMEWDGDVMGDKNGDLLEQNFVENSLKNDLSSIPNTTTATSPSSTDNLTSQGLIQNPIPITPAAQSNTFNTLTTQQQVQLQQFQEQQRRLRRTGDTQLDPTTLNTPMKSRIGTLRNKFRKNDPNLAKNNINNAPNDEPNFTKKVENSNSNNEFGTKSKKKNHTPEYDLTPNYIDQLLLPTFLSLENSENLVQPYPHERQRVLWLLNQLNPPRSQYDRALFLKYAHHFVLYNDNWFRHLPHCIEWFALVNLPLEQLATITSTQHTVSLIPLGTDAENQNKNKIKLPLHENSTPLTPFGSDSTALTLKPTTQSLTQLPLITMSHTNVNNEFFGTPITAVSSDPTSNTTTTITTTAHFSQGDFNPYAVQRCLNLLSTCDLSKVSLASALHVLINFTYMPLRQLALRVLNYYPHCDIEEILLQLIQCIRSESMCQNVNISPITPTPHSTRLFNAATYLSASTSLSLLANSNILLHPGLDEFQIATRGSQEQYNNGENNQNNFDQNKNTSKNSPNVEKNSSEQPLHVINGGDIHHPITTFPHPQSTAEFLIQRALLSPTICNKLFWHFKVESMAPSDVIFKKLILLLRNSLVGAGQSAFLAMLQDQQQHLGRTIQMFTQVKNKTGPNKVHNKLEYMKSMLNETNPSTAPYFDLSFGAKKINLPIDPSIIVQGLKVEKCSMFKSAKTPLLLTYYLWKDFSKRSLRERLYNPNPNALGSTVEVMEKLRKKREKWAKMGKFGKAKASIGKGSSQDDIDGDGGDDGENDFENNQIENYDKNNNQTDQLKKTPEILQHLLNSSSPPALTTVPTEAQLEHLKTLPTYRVMFKCGDDLRQDQLVVSLFRAMTNILNKYQFDLEILTYNVIATSPDDGYVEFVVNSETVQQILKDTNKNIKLFLNKDCSPNDTNIVMQDKLAAIDSNNGSNNNDQDTGSELQVQLQSEREIAMHNYSSSLLTYIKSCAAYCVMTHIIGIGDRHLENILVNNRSQLFHIDFGFIFGKDPKPMPPTMKLSKEMVDAMGGEQSRGYALFKTYCCIAFNILRQHSGFLIDLLTGMITSDVPGFQPDPYKNLQFVRQRFQLELSDEQSDQVFQKHIDDSLHAILTVISDHIHSLVGAFQ